MTNLAAYTIWVPTLLLVIFRVAGIFLVAPVLSSSVIPARVKVLISVIIGLAITGQLKAPVPMPADWVSLVLAIGSEMMVGAVIGYVAALVFAGIEVGAELIGQQMGIGLATVFNPMLEDTTSVLGTLFQLTALAIFLLIGGHRMMIQALTETFHYVPVARFSFTPNMLRAILSVLTASFVLAIKVAAPATVALFLASLAMGLIQRTMPQLNILSAGFQIRVMLALTILAASVAVLAPLIQEAWAIAMRQIGLIFT